MVEQECRSLRTGELPLTDEQIEELKRRRRLFKFRTFAGALQFATIIGAKAEAQGHYPKLAVGGLHPNDFIMAAKTDEVYNHWFELTGRKDVEGGEKIRSACLLILRSFAFKTALQPSDFKTRFVMGFMA